MSVKKIGICISCHSAILSSSVIFRMENMPVGAQMLPSSSELKEDRGIELPLVQCPHCKLVQIICPPVEYYRRVIRAGSISTTTSNLRLRQYRTLMDLFDLEGKRIIEIGCGKGDFMKLWSGFNVIPYGIEEDPQLVRIAQDNNLNVYRAFAGDDACRLPGAPYDAFTQFNFLEHQPDPNKMLSVIHDNLVIGGGGVITLPSLEYMLEKGRCYEIVRDHLAYYTMGTACALLERNGFKILRSGFLAEDTLEFYVMKTECLDFSRMKSNLVTTRRDLEQFVERIATSGRGLAVWGASHQSFTALAMLNHPEWISYIIDSADFKQGKFSPASHIRIVSKKYYFEHPVDAILIMAPGYVEEISAIIRSEYPTAVEIYALRNDKIERV